MSVQWRGTEGTTQGSGAVGSSGDPEKDGRPAPTYRRRRRHDKTSQGRRPPRHRRPGGHQPKAAERERGQLLPKKGKQKRRRKRQQEQQQPQQQQEQQRQRNDNKTGQTQGPPQEPGLQGLRKPPRDSAAARRGSAAPLHRPSAQAPWNGTNICKMLILFKPKHGAARA